MSEMRSWLGSDPDGRDALVRLRMAGLQGEAARARMIRALPRRSAVAVGRARIGARLVRIGTRLLPDGEPATRGHSSMASEG